MNLNLILISPDENCIACPDGSRKDFIKQMNTSEEGCDKCDFYYEDYSFCKDIPCNFTNRQDNQDGYFKNLQHEN